jgi:hypothetical protein
VTYKGKVDWWIALAFFVGIATPTVSALSLGRPLLLAGPAFLIVLIVVCLYPQKYETSGAALRIRAGLITRTIPWSTITGVSPSTDAHSSLALSLDRVLIEYSSDSIIIAPDDQVRFFDDVASHCPQLTRRGMDLVIALN